MITLPITLIPQELTGQRIPLSEQLLGCAFEHDLAALTSRMRAHVHDMVSHFNDIRVMLYHQNRISPLTQLLKNPIRR
jgi:hypothetical protein